MKKEIVFADLAHDRDVSNASFPLGISFIASYAKKMLNEDEINISLFKYTKDFKQHLENNRPDIVGFSNFSWSIDLSHEFATRIKKHRQNTIILAGGPNFPIEEEKQKKFLKKYDSIDFYIRGEGEKSFTELFSRLKDYNFDIKGFKKDRSLSSNTYYLDKNNNLISGNMLSRLENLDDIPSPYVSGLMDKFFDNKLTPILQTTRGCPFKCTYCQEGQQYFNKIAWFSKERIQEDLDFIAQKTQIPNLLLIASNLGMYERDLDTCKCIAETKKKYGWPKHIEASLGKNKDNVFKAIEMLGEDIVLDVPVQSTDKGVLDNIKRRNISLEKIIEMAKMGNSMSEIILGLPGDSKDAHIKSNLDMISAGANVVRSHQLLMLPASEVYTDESRKMFSIISAFRLQPRCFGEYEIFNEKFSAAEIDELSIANSTMNFNDYLECRKFDLTVELFYNNGIFQEPINLLMQKGISTSSFIEKVHSKIKDSKLEEVYHDFVKENTDSFWKSREELENHIKSPGTIENYIEKNLRNNEQLKYRAVGFFNRMKELHEISFESVREVLKENGSLNEELNNYLDQLQRYSVSRKENLLSTEESRIETFNFDFVKLSQNKFYCDPLDYKSNTLSLRFYHSLEQKELIEGYKKIFGTSINNLGFMLSRSNVNRFYREIEIA